MTPARPRPPGLTRRQREIAALLAEGLTNREIAAALGLERGTIANHVEHILRRLGMRNRAEVAAWAARGGLAAGAQDG
jgi:DNA-binding NarL/FixJ family response regulator